MSIYNEFLNSLLPGNYALTKSMELTRANKGKRSGTLWYTKKFLTLYYYIFLSNEIETTAYQQAVIEIFDSYIESLPEEIRDYAVSYFYPENDAINFKSENFNLFSNFASYNKFATQQEKVSYYQSAKKYYFALLMGSGGQNGVKKMLKEAVQRPGFVYSHDSIKEIILWASINVCMREANAVQEISDNSIKYILSEETMEKACLMAGHHPVDEADIQQLNTDYPHSNPNYRGIENDMIGFIRNERQLLHYYGFFHSKSTGATDFEFSSLTPIGELALKANANEFLTIWEHQKIKMISQPATAEINDIPAVSNSPESFAISYTPYTDILSHLVRHNSLSLDEYKSIVSRKKRFFNEEAWMLEEKNILKSLETIKLHIKSFGRNSDIKNEDGEKELKKYLLGVRSDLPVDNNTLLIGALKYKNRTVTVENKDILTLLYSVYSRLDNYKIQKYESVFKDSEDDLKRRYIATITGQPSDINGKVKIFWDLYNIHPDNFIMLSIAVTIANISLRAGNIENMTKEDIDLISKHLFENFRNLFTALGIRTLATTKREIQKVVLSLKNEDYTNYLISDENHDNLILARYRNENSADLLARIKQVSMATTVIPTENRERNNTLVSMLKSYYLRCYAENSMLKCECCGEETFITNAGEPYVEFHHLIPFNIAYGPDHYLNLFALCPNCHRKIHFMTTESKRERYEDLSNNNYMHLCFVERLQELRGQNLLRSYHLEFLLADNAISLEEYNNIVA